MTDLLKVFAAEDQARWRRCADELPETFEELCLVVYRYATKRFVRVAQLQNAGDTEPKNIAAHVWVAENGGHLSVEVTHWRPIGELPV